VTAQDKLNIGSYSVVTYIEETNRRNGHIGHVACVT